jgi:hypothetical protein
MKTMIASKALISGENAVSMMLVAKIGMRSRGSWRWSWLADRLVRCGSAACPSR